jgi:hypothetical protein
VLGALDFIRPPSSLQGGIRHQPDWLSSAIVPTQIKEEEEEELKAQTVGSLVGHILQWFFPGVFSFFPQFCDVKLAIIHKK